MTENEGTPLLQNSEQESQSVGALQKKITLINGITIVIGTVIGSGIFLTPKGIQEAVGSPALSLIIWVVSAVISFIGALCYAELGTTIPTSGGTYTYLNVAFGPFIGFARLWVSLLIIEPSSLAVTLLILATYVIKPFFSVCDPPYYAVRLLSGFTLMLLTCINCWSVRLVTRVQDVFTYGKILALAVIIISGVVSLAIYGTSVGSLSQPWQGTNLNPGALVLALYSGLFSFSGWDNLNNLVEEMQNARKNLPIAIATGLSTCVVIFISVNISYYAVLTPKEIIESDAVAEVFAKKSLAAVQWIIPVFVAMACFGSLNSLLMSCSRIFFAAARQNHLPNYFAMISPTFSTPIPSIILTASLTSVYLCVSNVFDLLNFCSFILWLSYGFGSAALIYLRYSKPNLPRPFKINIVFPILFCIICFVLVAVPFYSATIKSLIGLSFIVSSIPVYLYFIRLRSDCRPKCLQFAVHKVTCFLQALLPVAEAETEDN